MCHPSCVVFAAIHLGADEVAGRRVLNVGALDENGSVRSLVTAWSPAEYVGVDIASGPGVDVVCRAEDLVARFGAESFDLVLSTEMLEHVLDWPSAVAAMKTVCRVGGRILLTTRSPGFPYHGYPADFWRFDTQDMTEIFGDLNDLVVESDPQAPGVFVTGRRTASEVSRLSKPIHSMVSGERVASIEAAHFRTRHYRSMMLRHRALGGLRRVARSVLGTDVN